jgi:hypothetical protein
MQRNPKITRQILATANYAAQTTTGNTGDFVCHDCDSVTVLVNLTTLTAGSILFKYQVKGDDNNYYDSINMSSLSATGGFAMVTGPEVTNMTGGKSYSGAIGRRGRIFWTVTTGPATFDIVILGH